MIEILLILIALIVSLSINGLLMNNRFRKEFDEIQLPKNKLTFGTIIFLVITAPFIGFVMLFATGRYGFVISVLEGLKFQGKITSEQEAKMLSLAMKSEKW